MQRTRRAALAGVIVAAVLATFALAHDEPGASGSPDPTPTETSVAHDPPPEVAVEAFAADLGHFYEWVRAGTADDIVRLVAADEAAAAERARLAAEEAERAAQQAYAPVPSVAPAAPSGGGCASGGGDYSGASAEVVTRESRGDYCARNASGACGAYQIMPGTWAGYGGYASACDAPPAVQDEKARSMARCNWEPPNYCSGG